MQLGAATLHLLTGGAHSQDGGALFGLVPKTLWAQLESPDDRNCLDLDVGCLLIQTPGLCILVDTGLGTKQPSGRPSSVGRNRLTDSLATIGLEPADIDLVINTHLHHHHCGGNTCYNGEGRIIPTFPRATYCVQRLELADAYFPNMRTRTVYVGENIEPLESFGQVRVLSGDTRLSDNVRVVVTPGHTRAHQCVVIESEGETALFLGDAAPLPAHMERLSWISAYDVEPLVSIETKRKIARWALERRALLVFGHRRHIGAGTLHPTERPDRYRLEPHRASAQALGQVEPVLPG